MPKRRRTVIAVAAGAILLVVAAGAGVRLLHPSGGSPARPTTRPAGVGSAAGGIIDRTGPAVPGGSRAAWATLSPHAIALRDAATTYAGRFAAQWWSYDATASRPGHFVPDDLLARVGPFLDQRALAQAGDLAIPPQTWQQIATQRQRSAVTQLHAYVPRLWDQVITAPGAEQIPPGTVMVTVTGTALVSWPGGSYTNPALAITVDVICQPPAEASGVPSCVVDYLFPRVAR